MKSIAGQKVVLIGLKSDCVDFEKWPQLTKKKLEEAFVAIQKDFEDQGCKAVWCLTDRGQTAMEQIEKTLIREKPDFVLIGAGVRNDPDHFILFEQAINLVHRVATEAKIVFNTLPYDSVEAVKRWL